jgi:ribonuclease HII
LDRLGPTVHHRRFFAPVVAARERHQATTIEPAVIAMDAPFEVEVSAQI